MAQAYTSEELYPFFIQRIPSLSQPKVNEAVEKEKIDRTSAPGTKLLVNNLRLFAVHQVLLRQAPRPGKRSHAGIREKLQRKELAAHHAVFQSIPRPTDCRITDATIELDTFYPPDSTENGPGTRLLRPNVPHRKMERAYPA